jgi:hypothetical protein
MTARAIFSAAVAATSRKSARSSSRRWVERSETHHLSTAESEPVGFRIGALAPEWRKSGRLPRSTEDVGQSALARHCLAFRSCAGVIPLARAIALARARPIRLT